MDAFLETKRIGDQLKRSVLGPAWHGPALYEILQDVTAREAATKPISKAHSIWEILLHVAAWEGFANRVLSDEGAPEMTPDDDWPPVRPGDADDEQGWARALDHARRSNQTLRQTLRRFDPARLDDEVLGRPYSYYFLLHGVVQHNLYHAGQVALLKKALRD